VENTSSKVLRTSLSVVAHSWLPILYVILSDAFYPMLINRYFAQINYNTSAGDRTISDAAIPVKPNSSIRFTGRTDILAKLKEHFTAECNDKLRRQKFFLLHGMGGIGKTQICLRFIEEMSD
jgi:hypothetical protein